MNLIHTHNVLLFLQNIWRYFSIQKRRGIKSKLRSCDQPNTEKKQEKCEIETY